MARKPKTQPGADDGMEKTFPRAKQSIIPGTVDDTPPEVAEAADSYLWHKRLIAASREKMNAAKEDLIAKMVENDCREILIDDGEKKLTLDRTHSIKIQARKKAEKDAQR